MPKVAVPELKQPVCFFSVVFESAALVIPIFRTRHAAGSMVYIS